ncbi:MAG: hypothetical protein OXP66_15090 [Candidatus Tectomicrobia bacterium]|nr:hypothetical protein [Candidatus Tectomicrobia bacterium]
MRRPVGVGLQVYGATAELSFGAEARGCLAAVSSTLLGLGLMEGVALCQGLVSPNMPGKADIEGLRIKTLAPDTASEVPSGVAGGIFASLAWEAVYRRMGVDTLLDQAKPAGRQVSRGRSPSLGVL